MTSIKILIGLLSLFSTIASAQRRDHIIQLTLEDMKDPMNDLEVQDDPAWLEVDRLRRESDCWYCPPWPGKHVVVLNEENIKKLNEEPHFVYFWHDVYPIARLALDWFSIATMYDSSLPVAAMSCFDWTNICEKFGIVHTPYMGKCNSTGCSEVYQGIWEKDAMQNWLTVAKPVADKMVEIEFESSMGKKASAVHELTVSTLPVLLNLNGKGNNPRRLLLVALKRDDSFKLDFNLINVNLLAKMQKYVAFCTLDITRAFGREIVKTWKLDGNTEAQLAKLTLVYDSEKGALYKLDSKSDSSVTPLLGQLRALLIDKYGSEFSDFTRRENKLFMDTETLEDEYELPQPVVEFPAYTTTLYPMEVDQLEILYGVKTRPYDYVEPPATPEDEHKSNEAAKSEKVRNEESETDAGKLKRQKREEERKEMKGRMEL